MEKNMARAVFVPTLPAEWGTRNLAAGLAGDDRARVSHWVVQYEARILFLKLGNK